MKLLILFLGSGLLTPLQRQLRQRGCLSMLLAEEAMGVFTTAVPIIKLFAWGEGDSGGHMLRETTNRGLCRLVCPSCTCESWGKGGGGARGV